MVTNDLLELQGREGGVIVESAHLPADTPFCPVHEAPLVVSELLTDAGALYRRTICVLGAQDRCPYPGAVTLV